VRWGRQRGATRALDLAADTGEIARALADFMPLVVANDRRPRHLRAEHPLIADHAGVRVVAADVLALPFLDESFGVVMCRLAAHRFPELLPVLRQVARVLRRGGSFLLADVLGADDSESASLIASAQKGRDPGHVRAFRPIEWAAFLRAVGLTVIDEAIVEMRRDWDDWTAPMSQEARAELDQVVRAAPGHCREALGVTFTGGRIHSFTDRLLVLRADKD